MENQANNLPFISICIPAYKRIDFLERLFASITIQSYKNFEVIVTDDSPGEEVKSLFEKYKDSFVVKYYRNPIALGTPENWNEGVRHASGEWIKIMHDDDWFRHPTSLQQFVNAVENNQGVNFFFSDYQNMQHGKDSKTPPMSPWRLKQLIKNPVSLLSSNIIGPPSVTLYKNLPGYWYDKRMKWLVDIDFYIRYLQTNTAHYISEKLVNVGIHQEQVTQTAFRVASVEIPESIQLLEKIGNKSLKNIMVFDSVWRLMRNLNIKTVQGIKDAGYDGEIPQVITFILKFQKNIPLKLLKVGVISKLLMSVCYTAFVKIRNGK